MNSVKSTSPIQLKIGEQYETLTGDVVLAIKEIETVSQFNVVVVYSNTTGRFIGQLLNIPTHCLKCFYGTVTLDSRNT